MKIRNPIQTPYNANLALKSIEEGIAGLSVSMPDIKTRETVSVNIIPKPIENITHSPVAFNPGSASTPIKPNVTDCHRDNPIWRNQHYNTAEQLIIEENSKIPVNATSCIADEQFWPVATIDNIIQNDKFKGQDIKFGTLCTEKIFEVPNTMMAYVFDQATDCLQPMKIIILDGDVATYEPVKDEQTNVLKENYSSPNSPNSPPTKVRGKTYRKATLKWKKLRHLIPKRIQKPLFHKDVGDKNKSQLSGVRKRKRNEVDQDYKPPSNLTRTESK